MSTNNSLSVTVITNRIGKTPKQIRDSFIFDEIQHLSQKGVKIHVVRLKKEKTSHLHNINFHGIEKNLDAKTLSFIAKDFFYYTPLSLVRNPKTIYKENLYALNVTNIINKFKTDLIHAHFAYPEGLVGLFAKKHTHKPLIITVHGYDILTEPSTGYGARLNKKINSLIKKVLKNADAIITASKATFNEVKTITKNTNKIHLIPNSVDTKRFNLNINSSKLKKKLQLKDKYIIFTLRNHEPQYGLKYLIQAFSIVKKTKKNVILIVGGDGSQRKYLEGLTKKLGIDKETIFTGKIPRTDVPMYFTASDIVVVPSLQEAFGLVISEAMASGKPVIGSNIGGIPDQIIHGFNGFLVKPKDPKQIAQKILFLLNNLEKAKTMGLKGREIVLRKFNINKRTKNLIFLYNELLKAKIH
ncbi:MAG: glycosyltransferase family 4 protein [Candidatus Bathyarchaeota archaeon]|nr:glycosyltransferase family 4 protein [Candidatus Bathyarchaeota archaeon]